MDVFKLLSLLLGVTGIICVFQFSALLKDDVGKTSDRGKSLVTRSRAAQPELLTDSWRTRARAKRAAVTPSENGCPRKWSHVPNEWFKCPESFCQHVSYRCEIHCQAQEAQETGRDCELQNCAGAKHCPTEEDYNISISQVCDGVSHCPIDDESACAEPCQPFCMCIGLMVDCSSSYMTSDRFSFVNISVVTKKDNSRYLRFPHLFFLSYLVISDISNVADNFINGLYHLKFLDLSNNSISSLTDHVFSGLPVLTVLNLSNNQIAVFSDNVFRRLNNLKQLYLSDNQITILPNNVFSGLSLLYFLDLSNNFIQVLPRNVFSELFALDYLNLFKNKIQVLPNDIFSELSLLSFLDLSNNQIEILPDNIFNGLFVLDTLDLSNNKIEVLPGNVFSGLSQLTLLDLKKNQIKVLPDIVFSEFSALIALDLSNNNINALPDNVFRYKTTMLKFLEMHNNQLSGLPLLPYSIEILNIKNNSLIKLPVGTFLNNSKISILNIVGNKLKMYANMFEGLDNLTLLLTDVPFMCCAKPKSVTDDNCFASSTDLVDCWSQQGTCKSKDDAISSCYALIESNILRVFLWIIGVCALIGNLVVIFYRVLIDKCKITQSYSLFIINLALSDLLMGIYLVMIGVVDAYYRGVYAWNEHKWRNSILCKTAGIFSSISSEMSTFLILLVTIDRLIVIVFPMARYYDRNISAKQASIISGFLWLVSITIAVIPIISMQSYFKGNFYSQSGVCLALPLTTAKGPGAMYSFAVFVGLNSLIFVVIVVCQICIFISMKRRGDIFTSSLTRQRDINVAKTLFFVVATDFFCWFPIGVIGVATKLGAVIPLGIYAWVMVFVLPINAAVNPVLYTVTEIWRKRRRAPKGMNMTPMQRHEHHQNVALETETAI